ncbi:hypothetical protein [Campylobacter troglodytis]|uniref:hypothetical protein n=1 Tax=Campylobacter troglodytis TaxID=654363 RepID=UPI001158DC04|nr:hypothetical protein [Campylobacter troglodytis]TQR56249.1 hypothetical protein DMC01_09420 [Campylobacter troglodytis]
MYVFTLCFRTCNGKQKHFVFATYVSCRHFQSGHLEYPPLTPFAREGAFKQSVIFLNFIKNSQFHTKNVSTKAKIRT